MIDRRAIKDRQVIRRVEVYSRWALLALPFNQVAEEQLRMVEEPYWDESRKHVVKHREVRRIAQGLRLGLDLRGGVEMVYRIDIPEGMEQEALEAQDMAAVVRRRIDQAGLKRPRVQHMGEGRILIQIPGSGATDIGRMRDIIKRTGRLEFRIVVDKKKRPKLYEEARKKDQKGEPPREGYHWYNLTRENPKTGEIEKEKVLVSDRIGLTGEGIDRVNIGRDPQSGDYQVNLSFTDSDAFYNLTVENVGEQLGILLDDVRDRERNLVKKGRLHSAPVINEPIPGNAQISGRFTRKDAEDLKYVLQSGSLKWPLVLESERRVGPYQGLQAVEDGQRAIIIGFLAVIVFILLYYHKAGVIANVALLLNLLILLAVLKTKAITLTLPGIAGILLTIGMSIDANVLIFERIREEIKKMTDKPLLKCLRDGHSKALVTIVDANLTTLITALILHLFGTGPVKGFAITLSIGIVVSMFTAIVVTRLLFEALIQAGLVKTLGMAEFFKRPNIPFISMRKASVTVSAVLVVAGLVYFFAGPGRRLGIEFMSGTRAQVNLKSPVSADVVRDKVRRAGYEDIEVQEVWERREEPGLSFAIRIGFAPSASVARVEAAGADGREIVLETNSPMEPEMAKKRLARRGVTDVDIEEQSAEGGRAAYALRTTNPASAARLDEAAKSVYGDERVVDDLRVAFREEDGTSLLVDPPVQVVERPDPGAEDGTVTVRVSLAKPTTPELLRRTLAAAEADVTVVPPGPDELTDGKTRSFTVHVEEGRAAEIERVLRQARFEDGTRMAKEAFASVEKIYPSVARRLGFQAGVALFLAFLAIVAYVWFRFEFRFGLAAVVALVHDVSITLAALALTGRELSLTIIAALLTIIGYSLNDTIVVFDRIRENRSTVRKTPFPDIVNLSINQTLSRTVLTSLTTLLAVVALFVFGGTAIEDFAFTLLVGVIVGTYSSMFIASPVLLMMGEQGALRGPLSARSARIARPLEGVRGR
ncbi:MAG: protein translocase subunit SecD [Planctomycetota bacterium]